MSRMLHFFGASDIKKYVRQYFENLPGLKGKVIIDLPAGKGYMSQVLHDLGAKVMAYDLFPQFFSVDGVDCREADLMGVLPLESDLADIILCQEGIEHLPNQLSMLREFNRILKDNGTLVLTAPSISNLRAKMSHLLTESELYKRMPPNELDAVWFAEQGKMYFGHIFLIGIQRLRVLAVAAGFRIKSVQGVKVSTSSLFLGFLYPLIALVNVMAYYRNVNQKDGIDKATKRRVYGEILRMNLHPTILFGKHLFIEFEKVAPVDSDDLYINRRA